MLDDQSIKFYMEHCGKWGGAGVIEFQMVPERYDKYNAWPTFTMRKGSDVFTFVLSRDEEGNGGGFAFIEDA